MTDWKRSSIMLGAFSNERFTDCLPVARNKVSIMIHDKRQHADIASRCEKFCTREL